MDKPINYFILSLSLFLSLVQLLATTTDLQGQEEDKVHLKYSVADTNFAVVIHPQFLLNNARNPKSEIENFKSLFESIFGIKLNETNQLFCQFGSEIDGDDTFSVAVRSDKKIDSDKFLAMLFNEFSGFERTEQTYKTYTLITSGMDFGPCYCLPDEFTAIYGSEQRVKILLDGKKKNNVPQEFVDVVDTECDFCGYVNFKEQKGEANVFLNELASGLPFTDDKFVELLDTINTGYFVLNFDKDIALECTLDVNSESNATRLAEKANDSFRTSLDHLKQIRSRLNDVPSEPIVAGLDTLQLILKNATASSEKNRVYVKVENKGGIASARDSLIVFLTFLLAEEKRQLTGQ